MSVQFSKLKSVHIRSYSSPYFLAFGLNTERYISPYLVRMWKNKDQNNSEYVHLMRSVSLGKLEKRWDIEMKSL